MPELPENEAQRRMLERECLNRTIVKVELGSDTSYITLPGDKERQRLVGCRLTRTRRHGKNIFVGSKSGPWLAVHLGMTGKLIAFDVPDDPPDKTKLLITFEGDRRLAFRCPRKLGKVRIIDDVDAFIEAQKLGPDALEISAEQFEQALGSSRSPIKAALMDQTKLAGVGNLWSDETLFQAQVDPTTSAGELSHELLYEMHKIVQRILSTVVQAEEDMTKLPEDWLYSHRKKGETCRRCGGTIASAKVGGRTAYFCNRHQR